MKLTARQIVSGWIDQKVSLINVERVLELRPFGLLQSLHDEEGPAEVELEIVLNMINIVPSLLRVADENFDLKRLVKSLFTEWKHNQQGYLNE